VSRFLAEGVNKLVIKKQFDIIPNAVNTDLFFLKEKKQERFRFIHVSNMVPLKNAEGILRAFKVLLEEVVDAELRMVGDKDPSIRLFAKNLGLAGKITFAGEIPYANVAKEMQESHALILFSHIENSPCVIGEALCCGLPVIATRTGGIPELVDDSNSILITPRDEALLTIAMRHMIHDYARYSPKEIAEAARNKFSYSQIGRQLDTIYQTKIKR
jgi:glycosyltransferase involved in cell wall biosynthesis